MISLISRWKLRNGADRDLLTGLVTAVAAVRENEPGTLVYAVHLDGPSLIGVTTDPPPIALDQQTEVVFFEVYAELGAFTTHMKGEPFTTFKDEYLHHFYENPAAPGWPVSDTVFLDRVDALVRPEAGG